VGAPRLLKLRRHHHHLGLQHVDLGAEIIGAVAFICPVSICPLQLFAQDLERVLQRRQRTAQQAIGIRRHIRRRAARRIR
jgi:hypothetical protein